MYIISLKTTVYRPHYSSWNKSVDHLFPYRTLEKESERLAMLFQQDEKSILKQRELNIMDILRIAPNATRKLKKGFTDYDYADDSVWPLPPLDGCPKVIIVLMNHLLDLIKESETKEDTVDKP